MQLSKGTGIRRGPKRRSSGPALRADRSGAETGYRVSWCVGHLVELSAPEHYDESYSKWRLSDLPILPENWHYEISPGTRKEFNNLKTLMERPDVDSLVCATDAGREGELIFRLVYNQCRCKKPFERLWISSMEDAAIREGFRDLKPGSVYDNLYEAALCRERADWIVGMNATRLFSCLYGTTLAVGRVMTPTLGMAVMREAQIQAFKPEPFYEIELQINGISAKSERMKERSEAEEAVSACISAAQARILSSERKEKSEKPHALYDLTSLQRDANRILGFTAQQTLDYPQSLYEKKLVTYPRTDSRYLTDDMTQALPALLNGCVFDDPAVSDRVEMTLHPERFVTSSAATNSTMRKLEDQIEQNDNQLDGIINNLPDPEPLNKPDPMKEAKDAAAAAEKTSILEKLREEERARRERPPRQFLPGREERCLE